MQKASNIESSAIGDLRKPNGIPEDIAKEISKKMFDDVYGKMSTDKHGTAGGDKSKPDDFMKELGRAKPETILPYREAFSGKHSFPAGESILPNYEIPQFDKSKRNPAAILPYEIPADKIKDLFGEKAKPFFPNTVLKPSSQHPEYLLNTSM